MRLLRVKVVDANTCGGLLNGLDLQLRNQYSPKFQPLCLIGPNGAGKSQFLQILAEIFQVVFHAIVPQEERIESNSTLQFEVEYLIQINGDSSDVHVLITRLAEGKRKPVLVIQRKEDDKWVNCALKEESTHNLLPTKVVGYTSGDNETLSLPFLISRGGYADEVANRARGLAKDNNQRDNISDTRLLLIDYGTHLEVLVANLLLGRNEQRAVLLQEALLHDVHSFRCIIQLAHSAAPELPMRHRATSKRKGIQLTPELEGHIENLRRCSTCYSYEEKTETYIFDFFVNDQTRLAFNTFWDSTIALYSAFHKLSMLNDLAIPWDTRKRFRRETKQRHFAARLPEPQDEEKVFRFERVNFFSQDTNKIVDYVSLSDGEHQLAQILGVFCMVSFPNVLFLLDEPESHFNPQWRVKFIKRVLDLPTSNGTRRERSIVSQQDCLLTTHAPFVPSDIHHEQVFIFSKDDKGIEVRWPDIETYGATFDAILNECFGVRPPISEEPRQDIKELMKSNDVEKIKEGMKRLGNSVEKVFLANRLRELMKKEKA